MLHKKLCQSTNQMVCLLVSSANICLRIVTLAKFNYKKWHKMNVFVQNCLFLQHFPYY